MLARSTTTLATFGPIDLRVDFGPTRLQFCRFLTNFGSTPSNLWPISVELALLQAHPAIHATSTRSLVNLRMHLAKYWARFGRTSTLTDRIRPNLSRIQATLGDFD